MDNEYRFIQVFPVSPSRKNEPCCELCGCTNLRFFFDSLVKVSFKRILGATLQDGENGSLVKELKA